MTKPNKPPKKGISVTSLGSPEKDGWLTKQGGSWKNWKRRWFVLKGDCLYYFKTNKDTEETGIIELTRESVVREEPKKKRYAFSVATTPDAKRIYYMYPDNVGDTQDWIHVLNTAIDKKKASGPGSAPSIPVQSNQMHSNAISPPAPSSSKPKGSNPRDKVGLAKDNIPFLQEQENKVLEFWMIWSESIPASEDLQPGLGIEFHLAVSASLEKLTWRTAGPQNIFIQKMVDFFWNVGAPESEIDRLNDVGALINPVKIGSWIDMSSKGGMDGGWYFPVEIPIKLALEAADPGEPATKLKQWADKHNVEKCYSVGRDMGAAPPRQTEFRLRLPGNDFGTQLKIALDAYEFFGFPQIPADALAVLRNSNASFICLSVITSSDGFVRLGLLSPTPSSDSVVKLCTIAGGSGAYNALAALEGSVSSEGPAYVEYQFLKDGFGYGVYKEGFDVVFHYDIGEERVD